MTYGILSVKPGHGPLEETPGILDDCDCSVRQVTALGP